jgi:hypothetical protein
MRISTAGIGVAGAVLAALAISAALPQDKDGWRDTFPVNKANLTDRGRNTYFILEPGHRLHLKDGDTVLTVTVLDETRMVDGVLTRVVEERESKNGQLIEISRNFFAIDKTTKDVYYFGEDVDMYKNGKVINHEGAWLSGVNGGRFGLFMPDKPRIGDRFYQEIAPKVAMDRAEVISLTEEVRVPAGTFKNCLRTKESSGIEMGSESKWYAPGVGLIRDADFVLIEH